MQPIGTIRSKWPRRIAVLVVSPLIVIWVFNWRLIVFPLAVAWNALEFGAKAAWESVVADFTVPSMRLMYAGFRAAWNGDFIDEKPVL